MIDKLLDALETISAGSPETKYIPMYVEILNLLLASSHHLSDSQLAQLTITLDNFFERQCQCHSSPFSEN